MMKNIFLNSTKSKKISRFFSSSKLNLKFDYGQDSTLRILTPGKKIQADIEALWEDHTEVELFLKKNESEKKNNFLISDEGKNIFIKLNKDDDSRNRKMKLKIPEYSSLDLECRGEVIQHDTNIDAKMKGSLRIVSDDPDPEGKFEFKRVKTEKSEIRLKNSNLYFRSYWETRNGILEKFGQGEIGMKRFGVSNFFEGNFKDCSFDVKTTFANPVDEKMEHRISLKGLNSKINFGIFRGSIQAEIENSQFKINEGNFDGLDLKFKDSVVDIYFNEITKFCGLDFENCEVKLRVSPLIKDRFEDPEWVSVKEKGSNVEVTYEEYQSNLFGYLMRKYNVNHGNRGNIE